MIKIDKKVGGLTAEGNKFELIADIIVLLKAKDKNEEFGKIYSEAKRVYKLHKKEKLNKEEK